MVGRYKDGLRPKSVLLEMLSLKVNSDWEKNMWSKNRMISSFRIYKYIWLNYEDGQKGLSFSGMMKNVLPHLKSLL